MAVGSEEVPGAALVAVRPPVDLEAAAPEADRAVVREVPTAAFRADRVCARRESARLAGTPQRDGVRQQPAQPGKQYMASASFSLDNSVWDARNVFGDRRRGRKAGLRQRPRRGHVRRAVGSPNW